jgi:Ca2+/H+ antiporter
MGPSEPKGLGFCGHARGEELPILFFCFFMATNGICEHQGVSCSFAFVCLYLFFILSTTTYRHDVIEQEFSFKLGSPSNI